MGSLWRIIYSILLFLPNFECNNIENDGARAFEEVFKTNKTLTYLDLNGLSLKPFVCLRLLFLGNEIDEHLMGQLNVMAKLNDTSDSLDLGGIQSHLHTMCSRINSIDSYIGDSEAVLIADALKQRDYKSVNLKGI